MAKAAASSVAYDDSPQSPSAMIVTLAEKTELLTCVKCCKIASQPVLVGSCLHSMCYRCAAGSDGEGGGHSNSCPRCGAEPEADSGDPTARVHKPNHLADLLGRALGTSRDDAPCDFCVENDNRETPAVRWCGDCNKYVCLPCSAWHGKFFKSHKSRVLVSAAESDTGADDSVDRQIIACEVCKESAGGNSVAAAAAVASAVSWCNQCLVAMCRECLVWHDKFHRQAHSKVQLQAGDTVVRPTSLADAAIAPFSASSAADYGSSSRRSATTVCRQHGAANEYFCDICDVLKCSECSTMCVEASHRVWRVLSTEGVCNDLVAQRAKDATVALRAGQASLEAAVGSLDSQSTTASELKRSCEADCAALAENKRLVLDVVDSVFEQAEQTIRKRYGAKIERLEAALTTTVSAGEQTSSSGGSTSHGRRSLRDAAGHVLSYARVLQLFATADPALVVDQQRLVLSRLHSLTDRLAAAVSDEDDDWLRRGAVRPATDLASIERVVEQLAGLHTEKQEAVSEFTGSITDVDQKPEQSYSGQQQAKLLNSQKDDEDYWSEENRKPGARLVPRNPGATRIVVNIIEDGPVREINSASKQWSASTTSADASRGSGMADAAIVGTTSHPSASAASAAAAADSLSSGYAVSIPPSSRTFDVRGDCRDIAVTGDGRVLLAALTKGMRQYASDGRQLPTWRPPRVGTDRACVSTVDVLSDGRAAVGIINQGVIVLLRLLAASSPGLPGSTGSAVSDAWTEEARIRLSSKPYRMTSHGDWLVVAGAHTSERRANSGVLAVMVSTQCGPGPEVDLVSTTERRMVKRRKLEYSVISATLAGTAAETLVVASSEKQLTSDGRWHFVVDAYDRDGDSRLWRYAVDEEVYDLVLAPPSTTSSATAVVATGAERTAWILYVMLPESRRVAAVDGATGEWLADAYRSGNEGHNSLSDTSRRQSPKPVRLAMQPSIRDRSAVAVFLYINDTVSLHEFVG